MPASRLIVCMARSYKWLTQKVCHIERMKADHHNHEQKVGKLKRG